MPDSIIKADNISSLSGGGVGFPDGSVSNPSLKFTNDSDTGLYRIGNNTIGIASNGVRVGEINNLGIINGTQSSEYRNILQIVQGQTGMFYSTSWTAAGGSNYWLINKGIIIPKSSNSKIIISGVINSYFNSYTINNSYIRLYYSTIDFGTVRTTNVATPNGTLIDIYVGTASDSGIRGWASTPLLSTIPNLIAGTTYYIGVFGISPGTITYSVSNSKTEIMFMEVI